MAAIAFATLLVLIAAAGLALAGLGWFPEAISAHAVGIQRMLNFTLAATGAFFVAGHLVLAWLVLRGARGRGAEPGKGRRQWLVAAVPAFFMALAAEGGVIALGLPIFGQYYGAAPADSLGIEITGRQFFWVVRYPGPDASFGRTSAGLVSTDNPLGLDARDPSARDDVVLLNNLWVPRGRPVRVTLRSLDVIHSFFVRELRLKQDSVPGMSIPVWFEADRSGDYEIACNQICGLGHYRMRGLLSVREPAEFERWLGEQEAFGGPS